ncbi:hypothetical protein HGA64_04325 [Candidatus Falkowbacteria bacterium]|nr:hypothetical protein [Candidatus Falkowbacteria bacterium]
MIIKNCSAIVVAVVLVTVGEITKDEGRMYMVKELDGKFFFTVSKSVADKLCQGEKIVVICEPTSNFGFAKQVFFLAKLNGIRIEEILLGSGTDWYEMYLSSISK